MGNSWGFDWVAFFQPIRQNEREADCSFQAWPTVNVAIQKWTECYSPSSLIIHTDGSERYHFGWNNDHGKGRGSVLEFAVRLYTSTCLLRGKKHCWNNTSLTLVGCSRRTSLSSRISEWLHKNISNYFNPLEKSIDLSVRLLPLL